MAGQPAEDRDLERWKRDYLRRWKSLRSLQGEFGRTLEGLYDRLPMFHAFLRLWAIRWRLALAARRARRLTPPARLGAEARAALAGAVDDLAAGITSWSGAVTYLLTFLKQAADRPGLSPEDLHGHLAAARAYMEQASARFACGLDAVQRVGRSPKLAG
ncbi:MAG: hypothetical protein ACM3RP_10000 [Chitinophagales bacterium]